MVISWYFLEVSGGGNSIDIEFEEYEDMVSSSSARVTPSVKSVIFPFVRDISCLGIYMALNTSFYNHIGGLGAFVNVYFPLLRNK